jgi:deoxyribodipyrimidine photolyase
VRWGDLQLSRRRIQLVWFKRDLRLADHAPLAEAAARGPVLPLYVVEPGLWAQGDAAGRHWAFVRESLGELRDGLARLGQPLVVRSGTVVEVLAALRREAGIAAVWSHQETGARIGRDYPAPIVDHVAAARSARQRMQSVRRTEAARDESRGILGRHGSRKRPGRPRRVPPSAELFTDER